MQRGKRQRNMLIALDYAHGATRAQLAEKYEISLQRVAQVLYDVATFFRSHPNMFQSERMRAVIADYMRPRPAQRAVATTPEEFFWELMNERERDRRKGLL